MQPPPARPRAASTGSFGATADARDRDDRQRGDRCDDAERLDRDSASFADVDEREQQLPECEGAEGEAGQEPEPPEIGARLVGHGIAQLERPVPELRRSEEDRRENRRARIDRSILAGQRDARTRLPTRTIAAGMTAGSRRRSPIASIERGSDADRRTPALQPRLLGGERKPGTRPASERDRARRRA